MTNTQNKFCCVTNAKPQFSTASCSQNMNASAPPFIPVEKNSGTATLDMPPLELRDHINLLYETTVGQRRLSADVDRQFKDMLHRRASTFASSSKDLGFCPLLLHDVDTGDAPPIKQSPRPPPLSAGNAEDEIPDEMLSTGVIEPLISEWASPVCWLRNQTGRIDSVLTTKGLMQSPVRMLFQFRTSRMPWTASGARWFASLDLLSGYWQLGLTGRAKERSAFCTRRGLFQFTRMPFGLCGAPATFCRVMSRVLGDHIGTICLCYLDDVIVFGRTQKKLLDRLDKVLQRLHEHGLKVKPSKCVLLKTEIKFLGHLVTASGVQPLPDKVAAIQDWPTPRCLRDVRVFYGLIGYYR